jgi:hypothetical protein
MGLGANIRALLVGLAAFAGWTLSRFTAVPQPVRWVNLLGGVGILAIFFSIVSPDDDGFQQELIRPATPSVRVSAQTRLAARRSPSDLAINAFVKAGNPIRVPRIGRLLVMDQPFEHDTCFHGPFPIHSPPVAS